ncbi:MULTISPECIES: formyltransferase family protein [Aquimarina]|uniref:formyltransferase family protein n=1 Tax=Aquimarina TaxID=290174 RepID=UPI000414D361|nr:MULTISPECIES: formyltransferase family protein [Aquimarina]
MRLFLIISETCFYQPDFVADLIRKTNHDIVGAILVTKALPKSDIERYMIKNWYLLTPLELFKLSVKKAYLLFKNMFLRTSPEGSFYSVKKVFDCFNIDYFKVKYDINTEENLNRIRAYKPDIIISSNPLIFGNELLNIPKYCINRHSALLPSFGGLWPVFQAIRKGESSVGVSCHTMEKKIDKGILLGQKIIRVENDDTIDRLYQKCFKHSAEVVLQAIHKIEKNEIHPIHNTYTPSYFSFPKKTHWKELRKRKKNFI